MGVCLPISLPLLKALHVRTEVILSHAENFFVVLIRATEQRAFLYYKQY